MVESLDVIIIDDDPAVCDVIAMMIKLFYTWGQVYAFTRTEEAISFCRKQKSSVAIFVLDVFLDDETGFEDVWEENKYSEWIDKLIIYLSSLLTPHGTLVFHISSENSFIAESILRK